MWRFTFPHLRPLALLAACLLVVGLVQVQAAGANQAGTRLERLIAQLDDDEFLLREAAVRQLVLAGPEAVQVLKAAALRGSDEAAWRAVFALGEIAVAGNFDLSNPAEKVLEEISESTRRPAAMRAQDVLELLPQSRQTRAIAMIRSLGGHIDESGVVLRLHDKWTGGDNGLRYIRHLADITHLQIEPDAQVTEEGVEQIRKARPDMQVSHFGKAFLGVGPPVNDNAVGMTVMTVSPGSPADKAQIKRGDVIRKIDGTAINEFNDLVNVMRSKKVGDVITIEYDRGNQSQTTKAKLDPRPSVVPLVNPFEDVEGDDEE